MKLVKAMFENRIPMPKLLNCSFEALYIESNMHGKSYHIYLDPENAHLKHTGTACTVQFATNSSSRAITLRFAQAPGKTHRGPAPQAHSSSF